MKRLHGGPDGGPALHWDFSVNANAAGPCPPALAAVQRADRRHYPDPDYTALRQTLARFHGVPAWRVLVGGSASELILRISQRAARCGVRQVWWPAAAYGDYGHAAGVAGLQRCDRPEDAGLVWLCEPASPTGQAEPHLAKAPRGPRASAAWWVLDAAYEPLRLSGTPSLGPSERDALWQLWTPNKALGLTGVRAAYALAPVHAREQVDALEAAAPSWVLGADGVALLAAWTSPGVQRWLADSLQVLRHWKALQLQWLRDRGWTWLPGDTPFMCVRPPAGPDLSRLRAQGIALRDATSLGMPGWWRMAVLPPEATQALARALEGRGVHA